MNATVIRSLSLTLLCLLAMLALFACSSSSGPSPPVTATTSTATSSSNINKNLVYEDSLGNTTIKPHHTAVLNMSSLSDGEGTGYHGVTYEILNVGAYKFCVPDDDSHINRIELYDQNKNEAGVWKKGEVCTAKRLQPGKYTMHVHHAKKDIDPLIFIKPHAVTRIAKAGKIAGKTAEYTANIPTNQFVNQKVVSFSDLIKYNTGNGLATEQWGLWALNDPQFNTNGKITGYPKFPTSPTSGGTDSSHAIVGSPNITNDLLFNVKPAPNGEMYISQGGANLGLYVANNQVYALRQPTSSNTFILNTGAPPNTPPYSSYIFWLSGSGYVHFIGATNDYNSGQQNTILQAWGSGYPSVDFVATVRYGTTPSGSTLPALFPTDVALFDSCYGANGFSGPAKYWIVNIDSNSNRNFIKDGNYKSNGALPDFNEFVFDNPGGKIKSIMVGRGAQAQAYSTENYQGSSISITPPTDMDMIMTCTDSPQLSAGNVNSVQIAANTGDLTDYEYEHHTIISAQSCVSCDLRGFKTTTNSSNYGPLNLTGAHFSFTDFSNADFSARPTTFTGSSFSYAIFNNANLSNVTFSNTIVDSADFTGAILNNTSFTISDPQVNKYAYFYNGLPKFDNADLSGLKGGLDAVFPIISSVSKSYYPVGGDSNMVTGWWANGHRVSMKDAKLPSTLFSRPRLWQFIDAPGVDFSNKTLNNAIFTGANLIGANFNGATLNKASFVYANISAATFAGADLTSANLHGKNILKMNINSNTTLINAHFSGAMLNTANLSNLTLSGTVWKPDTYTNWDGKTFNFPATSLYNSYLYNTTFNGADLSSVYMAYVTWYGIKASGDNAILANTDFSYANMPSLTMKNAQMQGADFTDALLMGANLTTTSDKSFMNTNFNRTNLKGAILSGANFANAKLAGAVISASSGSEFIGVMNDPILYPNSYKYVLQNYSSTTPPRSTVGAYTCPNGSPPDPSDGCGSSLTDPRWKTPQAPTGPTNCTKIYDPNNPNADSTGNYIRCDGGGRRPAAKAVIKAAPKIAN